jgi:hypothetical protein
LPTRAPFKRQMRQHHAALVAFFLHLVALVAAQRCAYEALDSSGVPTRDAKRRGAGWLPGLADIGGSNRLGWYEGFHLLMAVNPGGGDWLWLWGCQPHRSPPGGDVLCPPSPSPPRPGERGCPSRWAVCRRQGLRRARQPADLVAGLGRPGHRPAEAHEPSALAQAAPALAGGGAADRRDRVCEALAYLPPRS